MTFAVLSYLSYWSRTNSLYSVCTFFAYVFLTWKRMETNYSRVLKVYSFINTRQQMCLGRGEVFYAIYSKWYFDRHYCAGNESWLQALLQENCPLTCRLLPLWWLRKSWWFSEIYIDYSFLRKTAGLLHNW